MAVSLTTAVNTYFGSKLIVPATGIILNNVMNDFSIPNISDNNSYRPAPANFIQPGKRPLSANVPLIVEFQANHTLALALGAAGGSRIITATVEAALGVFDGGLGTRSGPGPPTLPRPAPAQPHRARLAIRQRHGGGTSCARPHDRLDAARSQPGHGCAPAAQWHPRGGSGPEPIGWRGFCNLGERSAPMGLS